MNTQTSTNKPVRKLRDGRLSATVWRNPSESGFRYSVNLSRVYEDEHGTLRDSDSFSGSELLRISRLAQAAYDEILTLREQDKRDQAAAQAQANGS